MSSILKHRLQYVFRVACGLREFLRRLSGGHRRSLRDWGKSIRILSTCIPRNVTDVFLHHQVIVGFVGGALIAVAFLILYYLLAYDSDTCDAASANPVDDRLLRSMRGWARKRLPQLALCLERNGHRVNEALGEASIPFFTYQLGSRGTDCISCLQGNLDMCDLQILTGLGILIAGFVSLPVLKGAHWQMVCYLAWFATVTHLSGLSIMSKHLHGRSWERKSRMVLMGILLVVLVVAMVPMAAITISEDDGGEDLVLAWNCNATCFFSPQFMGKNIHSVSLGLEWGDTRMLTQTAAQFGSAIVAVALMCFSFVVRFGRITPGLLSTTKSTRASMSTSIQRVIRRIANKHFSRVWQDVLWRELLARPLLCVFLLLRTWILLWSSMFFEVCPTTK